MTNVKVKPLSKSEIIHPVGFKSRSYQITCSNNIPSSSNDLTYRLNLQNVEKVDEKVEMIKFEGFRHIGSYDLLLNTTKDLNRSHFAMYTIEGEFAQTVLRSDLFR